MSEHIEVSNQSVWPVIAKGVGTLTLYVQLDDAAEPQPPNNFDVGAWTDPVLPNGYCSTFLQANTSTVNGVTSFTIALNGVTKNLDLISGLSSLRRGAYIIGYSIDTGTLTTRPIPMPSRRLLFVSDSINSGSGQNTATQFSPMALLRPIYPGRVGFLGSGGLALWDCAVTGRGNNIGTASITELAQRAVNWLRQDPIVASIRELWFTLGVNDALINAQGRQSSANYGTMVAQFYDAVTTLDSGIKIYGQSPLLTNQEGTVNGFAESIPAYRTQSANAATGRPRVTAVAGQSMIVVGGIGADNLHMSNAGAQGYVLGTGGQQGAVNMRTVLGV